MKTRFQIHIDGIRFNATSFAKRPSAINGEWDIYALVEKWIRTNRSALRVKLNKPATKTNAYFVHVTDTMDGAVACARVYIQPAAPADAEDFNYLGCFDSIQYRYASSLSGDRMWWIVEDNQDLAARTDAEGRGHALITYTQIPPAHYMKWEGWKFDGVDEITAEVMGERGGDR